MNVATVKHIIHSLNVRFKCLTLATISCFYFPLQVQSWPWHHGVSIQRSQRESLIQSENYLSPSAVHIKFSWRSKSKTTNMSSSTDCIWGKRKIVKRVLYVSKPALKNIFSSFVPIWLKKEKPAMQEPRGTAESWEANGYLS